MSQSTKWEEESTKGKAVLQKSQGLSLNTVGTLAKLL